MSKYVDDSTFASNPGGLEVSVAKLRELEPDLLGQGTFKCSPTCAVDHPAEEMRERITEHMRLGDTQPAIVVSTDPLVVSAAAIDLDTAILLRFPNSFVAQYGLTEGSRLVSVNTYMDLRAPNGDIFYAVDVILGPQRSNWSNAAPFIADFICEDGEILQAKQDTIPKGEWNRLERNTKTRIEKWGLNTARDGKPTTAGTPVPTDPAAPTIFYRTLEGLALDEVAIAISRLKGYALIGLVVIGAIVLLYLFVIR